MAKGMDLKEVIGNNDLGTNYSKLRVFARYGFYPLWILILLAYAWMSVNQPKEALGQFHGYYLIFMVGSMLFLESLIPLKLEWRMTKNSFFRRDLLFMLVGGGAMILSQYLGTWLILQLNLIKSDYHQTLALVPSVILVILITDFLWYWVHRYSHEGKGRLGQLMWKIHAAHHMPAQVYVFMHAVAHPFNFFILRAIWTIPLFWLGFSVESLFVANLIIGLQGMFSHFNVDIRVGWLNYLLMSTELHRYHHSADPEEGKNYAATLSLWDFIFGTLYYTPDRVAERLGLTHPEQYPKDQEILKVMLMPFQEIP